MIGKRIIRVPIKRVKTHGGMIGLMRRKRIKIMINGGTMIHGITTATINQLLLQITKQLLESEPLLNTQRLPLKSTGSPKKPQLTSRNKVNVEAAGVSPQLVWLNPIFSSWAKEQWISQSNNLLIVKQQEAVVVMVVGQHMLLIGL